MSTEPEKKPSPILVGAAGIVTAYGLWQLFVGSGEAESALLTTMRVVFTGMGVVFLVVVFLRRNK